MTASPEIRIRPVGRDDDGHLETLLGLLSDDDRYHRWFTGAVDLRRAVRWAAHPEAQGGLGLLAFAGDAPVGHAVLVADADGSGEVAFEVAPVWRHHGIAGAFLRQLLDAAAARGLRSVHADVLAENADMLLVFRESGPCAEARDGGVVRVTLPVGTPA